MKRLVTLVVLASIGAGCAPIDHKPCVDFYEAVGMEYRDYVNADESLDDEQRARRQRTCELYEAYLEEAADWSK